MSRAVFVVPQESFRDEELFVTRDELEKAGWECTLASRAAGPCTGMRGGHVLASMALADVVVADYDAVVFVGGNGARMYFDDSDAHRIAVEADAKGKILAAICIAPAILARAGVLAGRIVTVHSSEAKALTAAGAHVQHTSVAADGRIVTADGPRAAHEFAEAIMHAGAPRRERTTTQSLGPRRTPEH